MKRYIAKQHHWALKQQFALVLLSAGLSNRQSLNGLRKNSAFWDRKLHVNDWHWDYLDSNVAKTKPH